MAKSIEKEIIQQKEIFEESKKPLETVEWWDDRFYKLEVKKDFKIPDSFNPNHVHYFEDGIELFLPSVTTILNVEPKPFLATWRGDIGNYEADRKMREAQDRGSQVHNLCEKLAQGKTIIFRNEKTNFPPIESIEGEINKDIFLCYSQEIMMQIARFNRLLDILKPKIIESEKNVYNIKDSLFYSGTIDYIWELEGGDYQISTKKGEHIEAGKYVVDLKTGKSCDKNYFLQTVAYTKALDNIEIKGNIIIHTNSENKTGIEGVKLFTETDLESYWEQFKNYYKTFQYINKDIKPKLYDIPYILQRKEINEITN